MQVAILCLSPRCQTLPNSFVTSRNNARQYALRFIANSILFTILCTCSIVLLFMLVSESKLMVIFFLSFSRILSRSIRPNNLERTGGRLMGLCQSSLVLSFPGLRIGVMTVVNMYKPATLPFRERNLSGL